MLSLEPQEENAKPHDHGGFGVTSNVIGLWQGCLLYLPDDLTTPSAWISPPLLAMHSIHDLLANYDCTARGSDFCPARWFRQRPGWVIPVFNFLAFTDAHVVGALFQKRASPIL
jgi:hypothetical protein